MEFYDNIKFYLNDIESMQILKDASSASIYGLKRAANGATESLRVTGATGNAKVSLTAQFGLNKVRIKVES